MRNYILRRILLMIPTLFGIMLVNFAIIQIAPGGPVERMIAEIKGHGTDVTARFSGAGTGDFSSGGGSMSQAAANVNANAAYRGAQGLDPELIKRIEKMYGFDKPAYERFFEMIGNYLRFDFGQSFYRDQNVMDMLFSKLPVSISLGLWTTLLIYLISIPLGIAKAVRDGSKFDVATSIAVVAGYAIPSFLFAIMLIVVFAGGSYFSWFPLRGLVSDNWASLPWYGKIADYFWHLALPLTAMVLGGFASLTMLTKNSFLEELAKPYVVTARAKGLPESQVRYRHVFRNAMLIVIAGFPGAFLRILFTSALLIEVIFSLDGLGLMGYEAALTRDYPVIFGTLYLFTLIGLVLGLISDLTYVLVDPRIDFEKRIT